MGKVVCLLWLAYLFVVTSGEPNDLILHLDDGPIQGVQRLSFDGRMFSAFEGIPFVAPPIGSNRFKDPQPVQKWTDILPANKTYTCIQFNPMQNIGTEDCLYLNVYVPRDRINSTANMDVVVHIHGGAFMMGDGNSYSGPGKVMDRDFIYVTFNYRLGPFGFLATEDNTFPGNYGMKDQVMALRWVQRNIRKFGGNPDSVTIIGLSAGGASVHLHLFSHNKSEVLFHRAWAESGSALDPWVLRERTRSESLQMIKMMDCDRGDMADCMRQKPAEDIVKAVSSYYVNFVVPLVPFGPVIEEQNERNPHPFLTKHPYEQLKEGHTLNVPLIFSEATHEGMLPAITYYNEIETLNKEWNRLLPLMLEYYDLDKETQDEISAKIKYFYLKDENLTRSNFDALVKVCSERLFHMGAEVGAKLATKIASAKTYFMLFGYKGSFDTLRAMFNVTGVDGVMHAAEGIYLYDSQLLKINFSEDDIKVKEIMLDILSSFAKSGVPSVKGVVWNPVDKTGSLDYLLIKGPGKVTMETTDSLGAFEFWSSLNLTHRIYGF